MTPHEQVHVDAQAVAWIAADVAAQHFECFTGYLDDLMRSVLWDEAFRDRLRAAAVMGWNWAQYRKACW